jgi:hypothetical protein
MPRKAYTPLDAQESRMLKNHIENHNMTQKKAAALIDVPFQLFTNFLNGKADLNDETLNKFYEKLNRPNELAWLQDYYKRKKENYRNKSPEQMIDEGWNGVRDGLYMKINQEFTPEYRGLIISELESIVHKLATEKQKKEEPKHS